MPTANTLENIGGGAATGALTGAEIGGGYGALIGGVAGGLYGGIKTLVDNKNKSQVPLSDPAQLAYLAELDRKRKALQNGTDYQYQLANQQIQKNLATTQSNALKAGGGDIGATMNMLNNAQQYAGGQSNQATNYLLNKGEQYDTAYGTNLDAIAQRKLQIQFNTYLQNLRQNAESRQSNDQNLMGSLAYLLGQGTGGNNATTPTTPTTNSNTGFSSYNRLSPEIQSNRNYALPTGVNGMSPDFNFFSNQNVGSKYANI